LVKSKTVYFVPDLITNFGNFEKRTPARFWKNLTLMDGFLRDGFWLSAGKRAIRVFYVLKGSGEKLGGM